MSTIIGAIGEVVATVVVFSIVMGGLGMLAHWALVRGPLRRWAGDTTLEDLPPVRRRESPVELYVRRQREQVNEWQEVDR
jgi:hypothetical protein